MMAMIQEAMEALRPFSKLADKWESSESNFPDYWPIVPSADLTVGDLRRAAAAFDSLSTHLKGEQT